MSSPWPTQSLETLVEADRPITYEIVKPGPDTASGVPYVRVVDMAEGTVRTEQLRRTSREITASYRRSMIRAGDVLLSIRGHVGRVAIVPPGIDGANLTQDTVRIALRPSVVVGYVRWYLSSLAAQHWMQLRTKGVAVRGINLLDVRELPVPIPSTHQQRRIADILDKADAIRQQRQESIRLTEDFLRSAFLDMFGEPGANRKGWPVARMADVVQDTQYGTPEKANEQNRGLPILRMNNITYAGQIDISDLKWCEIRDADRSKFTVRRGDLLFNRTNSPELVGKVAVWDRDDDYAFAGYLIRIRFHQGRALPEYISGYLNSAYGKRYLFEKAKPSNNPRRPRCVPIWCPPQDRLML